MKTCSRCKQKKTTKDFYTDRRTSDGLYSSCKNCHNLLISGKKRFRDRREWRRDNKDKLRAYRETIRKDGREKIYQAVHKAVKAGTLKKMTCRVCGVSKTEAHHPDYSRPLDVMWLCRKCHKNIHKP